MQKNVDAAEACFQHRIREGTMTSKLNIKVFRFNIAFCLYDFFLIILTVMFSPNAVNTNNAVEHMSTSAQNSKKSRMHSLLPN